MSRILNLFFALLVVSGCSDSLAKKLLNAKFPPASTEDQQKRAIDSLAESIAKMEWPALSAGVSLISLESAIEKELKKDHSIKSIHLAGNNQLLTIEAEIDKTFQKSDWEDNHDIKNILGDSDISFKGDINLSVTLVAKIDDEKGNKILKINLLPSLNSVSVKDIESEDIRAELIAEALFFLINRYTENINGQLEKLPALETKVPMEMVDVENPSQVIKSPEDSDIQFSVTLSSNDIQFPMKVGGHAIMIDKGHISAMVSFIPLERDEQFEELKRPEDFGQIKALYDSLHREAFGDIDMNQGSWVALTKEVVALSINNVINQAQACFNVHAVAPLENIPRSRIPPPNWEDIGCTPNKDCTPKDCPKQRDCAFHKPLDERPCGGKCLVRNPFGGCVIRGNDPACEAAKAAQNKIYDAEYSAKKLACEAAKTVEKNKCEAEKSVKKAACEATRTTQKAAC